MDKVVSTPQQAVADIPDGSTIAIAGAAQSPSASFTQIESHCMSQQNGSTAQTCLQHAASSQPGVSCGAKHDPASMLPQPGHPVIAAIDWSV